MTTDDSLHKTWEFKGEEIRPFAISARNHAINIVTGMSPGPTMFAAVIYCAICKKSEMMKGLRDPDWFLEKVSEWIEKVELGNQDYEELGRIFKELLEHSDKNRAVPSADPNMLPDPIMGNE